MRLGACQYGQDLRCVGAVAAADPMLAQPPEVARPSDRLFGDWRDVVGIAQTARPQPRQNAGQLVRLKAKQTKVEIDRTDVVKLMAQRLQIPARSRRQLIVGQPIGALFFLSPAARDHYRKRGQPQPFRRSDT
jgi:hypothetical protein